MISLEQIRLLEAKITKAVELIRTLRGENSTLRRTLDSAQQRMQDLEKLVGDLKTDQREIEQSILRAMENLDELEDEVAASSGTQEPKSGRGSKASTGPAPEAVQRARKAELPAEAPPEEPNGEEHGGEPEDAGEDSRELDIF
jgi:septal ring factor EnvC (AmiA/AmiB activator)